MSKPQEEKEEEELIDEETLLQQEDRQKPDSSSLRVCAETQKRKACANCSCGLADEIEQEKLTEMRQNTQNAKSSCGSCHLGDAFRCPSCPYSGLPAFRSGEQVVLDNSDDLTDL